MNQMLLMGTVLGLGMANAPGHTGPAGRGAGAPDATGTNARQTRSGRQPPGIPGDWKPPPGLPDDILRELHQLNRGGGGQGWQPPPNFPRPPFPPFGQNPYFGAQDPQSGGGGGGGGYYEMPSYSGRPEGSSGATGHAALDHEEIRHMIRSELKSLLTGGFGRDLIHEEVIRAVKLINAGAAASMPAVPPFMPPPFGAPPPGQKFPDLTKFGFPKPPPPAAAGSSEKSTTPNEKSSDTEKYPPINGIPPDSPGSLPKPPPPPPGWSPFGGVSGGRVPPGTGGGAPQIEDLIDTEAIQKEVEAAIKSVLEGIDLGGVPPSGEQSIHEKKKDEL
mmetsp:Transcript_16142/g.29030  ORF Transcript_16142/g.29030 Transcript_16142/m.29030 type:complete len:332 (-) Transcript_16142:265-1260(-)|eukprot:CAMPEP_0197514828 /NCGR_PEP_ID=MMETSP1318-20131121/148_1 /TAXON_ID=552666 /ORGANISM="Partenskyella glossopodia, Strain RCC365" /LENGTH=331 /DNA_ID=CAMNT_0043063031 /DNA_START=116 /DNA_END=1111 /DNA_ORIENTATION=+